MEKRLQNNILYISYIVLTILIIFLIKILKIYDICCTFLGIISPILFGFIFAWVFHPIHKKITKKVGNKLSCLIIIISLILSYTLLIYKILPIIISHSKNIIEDLNKYTSYLGLNKISPSIILSSSKNIISIISNIFFIHLFGFYILYNYETIITLTKKIIPSQYKKLFIEYTKKLSINMRLFLKGTLIDTFFLFCISSILFVLIRIDHPFLLSMFASITNIIPFIGPYIGGIPAVIVGLSKSIKLGILSLIVIIISQTIESSIINPLIMSKCIEVNPLFIVITITIMGNFFGIIGMMFAIPLLIVLKLTIGYIKKYKEIK